jgi:ribosomal protein S2
MAVVTMRQLLESGVHFGHQTRRWNPKMKRFIMTERNGIYIIDLQQSLTYINDAYEFIKETVAHGGTILFVGTKKQAQEAVAEQAQRVGMPYVNQRWLGGMLTNFQTVFKRLQRLKELEIIEQTGGDTVRTKKESLVLERERIKLDRTLGGIRNETVRCEIRSGIHDGRPPKTLDPHAHNLTAGTDIGTHGTGGSAPRERRAGRTRLCRNLGTWTFESESSTALVRLTSSRRSRRRRSRR